MEAAESAGTRRSPFTTARRTRLAEAIRRDALAWAVASATVAEIDELNILRASLAAMARAIGSLGTDPGEVVVDGLHVPGTRWPERAVVKGDRLVPAISAASILAKTARGRGRPSSWSSPTRSSTP